jgi:hypothetical protein
MRRQAALQAAGLATWSRLQYTWRDVWKKTVEFGLTPTPSRVSCTALRFLRVRKIPGEFMENAPFHSALILSKNDMRIEPEVKGDTDQQQPINETIIRRARTDLEIELMKSNVVSNP